MPALNAALDLLPLPDSVSDEAATVIEPLACCVRGLDRARVAADTRLLVIGGGQMGLLIAQAALARGADVAVAELCRRAARWRESLGARGRRRRPSQPISADSTVVMLATGAPAAWSSPSPRPTRAR